MEESKGGERDPYNPVDDSAMEVSGGGTADERDIPEFSLCAALVGHTGDVRSLAIGKRHLYSGARDSVVMAWPLDEDGHIDGTHVAPAAQVTLPDWVNALAVKSPAGGEEVIVGGCKDGGIYAVGWEEGGPAAGAASAAAGGNGAKLVVRKTLLGHNAPISSLSWTSEGLLLSGSWDETAKAWDLETATCKWTLGGHENNVCVLGLGSGSVATGSTGLSVEGHLVGQQIRMWEGSPPKEWRSLTDHTSGIRDLCLVDAPASSLSSSPGHFFCSASNDATVRVWSEEGDCRAVVTIPGGGGAGGGGGGMSAEGSVADVATGSADHAVRVFTPDSERFLRGDRLKEALEAVGGGSGSDARGGGSAAVPGSGAPGGGRSGGGGENLPSTSEMSVMVGVEDGQLSAFACHETGEAKVFRWTEAVGGGGAKWEQLGALRPPVRKVAFEGGLYDKVIPVEVESASRGFLALQLGVNHGDDPKAVADAFCKKHSLGPEYLPQIEQFLFIASL
ncbi:unnamed protein product [Ectocarpus sp. 6 AP-2014]